MWYDYFIGVICIATLLRLVFIMGGSLDINQKMSKASSWIIGLLMISIAWFVLSQVFGTYIGNFGKKGSGYVKPLQTKTPKKQKDIDGVHTEEVEIKIITPDEGQ